MKARILFFAFLIGIGASAFPVSWVKKVRYYAAGFRKASWELGISPSAQEVARQKELFGYDLSITHIKDQALTTVHPQEKRVKFFVHGFAENKNQAMVFSSDYRVIAGDFVTFNLPDRISTVPPFINRIYNTSFGQLNEVLPTLYALHYAQEALGLEVIDLIGFSRGGSVLINMLHVFSDTSGKYDADLARIGIFAPERAALLSAIEKGSVVLSCPLISMKSVLEGHWFLSQIPGQRLAIEKVTCYRFDGLDGLASLRSLKNFKTNVLLHVQHNDESVGNAYDAQVYATFAQLNPAGTYFLLGNDGGHKVKPKSLRNAVHTFYRTIGGAYNMLYDALYLKKLSSDTSTHAFLKQPKSDEAEKVIAELHAACERN